MIIPLLYKKPTEYTNTELVEGYFLDEYRSGDPAFISKMYKDRNRFLMDALLRFRESTDDYTDKEMLNKAIAHAILMSIKRELKGVQ